MYWTSGSHKDTGEHMFPHTPGHTYRCCLDKDIDIYIYLHEYSRQLAPSTTTVNPALKTPVHTDHLLIKTTLYTSPGVYFPR